MAILFYSGTVVKVIFDKRPHYILSVLLPGKELVTVKGDVYGMDIFIGQRLSFEGEVVEDKKYGRQIRITRAPVLKSWDADTVKSILSGHGVSFYIADKISKGLGPDPASILDDGETEPLLNITGVDQTNAEHVISCWRTARAYFSAHEVLSACGFNFKQINMVSKVFREETEEVLTKNPWLLVRLEGVQFSQCDDVARMLKIDLSSPLRMEGAILHIFCKKMGMGHLYLLSGQIHAALQEIIRDSTSTEVGQALISLFKKKKLILDQKTKAGIKAIYEPWKYKIETDGATLLLDRMQSSRLERDVRILEQYTFSLAQAATSSAEEIKRIPLDLKGCAKLVLEDWSAGSSITLSEMQAEGVINALTAPISVITGLPGTGKSTSLKALVSILRDAGISYLLMAPTGIAAKRMASVTGVPASTIHRALGATGGDKDEGREADYVGITGQSSGVDGSDGSGEYWMCSAEPHQADVVIIDEASMVDAHLLYRIVTCTKSTARIVFIGDAQQLPSVGPGNVLSDLIATGMFPTVSLTEIFRQAHTSQIVVAAHAIFQSKIPEASHDLMDEFVFIPAKEEFDVQSIVLGHAANLHRLAGTFQVMSPRHSGTLGVTNLNAVIREVVNPKMPGLQELRLGQATVREGDKVMVVKNDYELDVVNGDVGVVRSIDRANKIVEVLLDGPINQYVHFPIHKASEFLRLAYCTTVHKMQGQEVDTIILPLVSAFNFQLVRNLIYTAITRAKKKVIIVGHWSAFVTGIGNVQHDHRNTLFKDRILRANV